MLVVIIETLIYVVHMQNVIFMLQLYLTVDKVHSIW